MNNVKRDPVEKFLEDLFIRIFKIIRSFFRGFRKLRFKYHLIGLLVCILISLIIFFMKKLILYILTPTYIQYLIYYGILGLPIWYLIIIGSYKDKKQNESEKIFEDIDFIGKDKKYPYLLSFKEDGKKNIYEFKSIIPIGDWLKAKDRLETGFDCTILQIIQGRNKRIQKLITVSSSYKIPDMIPWNDELIINKDGVITIGESALSQISFDLNRTPHVLAAGETGSGKSVILRTILRQMACKGSKIIMIDFKGGVEFSKQYEKFGEVITERNRALEVLQMLVKENKQRLELFREMEVKNLKEYNQKTNSNLCRIGVFCDEIAEMLDKKGVSREDKPIFEQLEGSLSTLARLSRATGINLFLGVQRPDANVLTGQIKNNVPVRISGRFADKSASEIVLGNTLACDLEDIKGRFLFKLGNETIEFQAYYFDDDTMLHEIDVASGTMLSESSNIKSNEKKEEVKKDTISEEFKKKENISIDLPEHEDKIIFSFDDE